MSCYHPLPASRDRGGGSVTVGHHPGKTPRQDALELPCGRCIGCKLDYSRSWSIRAMHEAQSWDSNLFVTLDYAPEHLPESRSLEYPHYQAFMKRLRKELPGPIRFFVSGEYGDLYGRPHWHALLFNCRFPDVQRFVNGTARSNMAESIWKKGRVVIGEVTPASAAYVAGYTLSKVYGRAGEDYYEDVVNLTTGELTTRRAPFCQMSRKPGIGAHWYARFKGDALPHDFTVVDGKKWKVPLYYWRKYQEEGDPLTIERVAHKRFLRAMEVDRKENTADRRQVREEVALARKRTHSSAKVF